jgi:hypothetical protein
MNASLSSRMAASSFSLDVRGVPIVVGINDCVAATHGQHNSAR